MFKENIFINIIDFFSFLFIAITVETYTEKPDFYTNGLFCSSFSFSFIYIQYYHFQSTRITSYVIRLNETFLYR